MPVNSINTIYRKELREVGGVGEERGGGGEGEGGGEGRAAYL